MNPEREIELEYGIKEPEKEKNIIELLYEFLKKKPSDDKRKLSRVI